MADKRMSKGRRWTSYLLSGIVIIFMLFDGIAKLFKPESVVESTVSLGFEEHHLLVIAILGLVATLLYAFPRTAILGAILLTGYYGGVIATHVRLDNPLFSHTLFSVYLSLFVWGGLWLRDARIKRLFAAK
nr:DoxX family protein [Paenibacillus methanolicus]